MASRWKLLAEERFWLYVSPEPNSGCWLWTGGVDRAEYGNFSDEGRNWRAHRWAYEHYVGPIPDGLQLDHLCRVHCCVNPAHLEAVPGRVNYLRGIGPTAVNARKAICKRGHPLEGDNLSIRPNGYRECRQCRREADAARKRSLPHWGHPVFAKCVPGPDRVCIHCHKFRRQREMNCFVRRVA